MIARRSAVQRRMELDPSNIGMNQLAWRLAYAARSHNWPPILGNSIDQEKRILGANLTEMASFPENYGTFDITDDQHLALLYVRSPVVHPPLRADRQPGGRPQNPDGAEAGAGRLRARVHRRRQHDRMPIDTLGPHHDHSTTLLFGETKENPWAKQRGITIDFINHARRQIDLPSRNTNEYPKGARSTGMFVKREAFARGRGNRDRQSDSRGAVHRRSDRDERDQQR